MAPRPSLRPGPHYTVLTRNRTIFCPKLTFLIKEANDRRQCQRSKNCRSLDSLSVHYLLDQATTFRDTHLYTIRNALSQKLDRWHESDFHRHWHPPSTAFYIHSYFRILILSTNLIHCFFNLFQHSQRSSILQRDRTHYINGRHCSGDAAEMQREQSREKTVLSQNHLPRQPTRSQIYGSSSTDFFLW